MKENIIAVDGCRCVSNARVYGLGESVRRAKFPMATDTSRLTEDITDGILGLAQSPSGSGHDQWLTGVIVQFDLTLSNKAWVEAERYHFLDFVSSQSTMHRITKFDLDIAYNKYVDQRMIEIMKELVAEYNEFCDKNKDTSKLDEFERANIADEKANKYLRVLYSNPCGFQLTAGMTTNYRQLKTIYKQRRTHRLPEWREFCRWIEKLPHSELITGGEI